MQTIDQLFRFFFNENADRFSCCSVLVLLLCISVIRITSDPDVYIRLTEGEIGQSCKAQASYGMK
jgi:hypothetical protein